MAILRDIEADTIGPRQAAPAATVKTVQPVAWAGAPVQAAAPAWPAGAVRWQDLPDLGDVPGVKATARALRPLAQAAGYTGPVAQVITLAPGGVNEAGQVTSWEPVEGPSAGLLAELDRFRFVRYVSGNDLWARMVDSTGRVLADVKIKNVDSAWIDNAIQAVVAIGGALVTGGALGLIGSGATAAVPAAAAPEGAAVGFTGAGAFTPAAVQAETLAAIESTVGGWNVAADVLATAQAPSITAALAAATPVAAAGFTGTEAARVVAERALTTITPATVQAETLAAIQAAAATAGPAVLASAQASSITAALAAAVTPVAATGFTGAAAQAAKAVGAEVVNTATGIAKAAITGAILGGGAPTPGAAQAPATTGATGATFNPVALLAVAAALLLT